MGKVIFCLSNHLLLLFRQSEYGGVVFGGWARMAQPIVAFTVVEVAKPNIGENWPTRVRADVTINLNVRDHIKDEWEGNSVFQEVVTFCLLLYRLLLTALTETHILNIALLSVLSFIFKKFGLKNDN